MIDQKAVAIVGVGAVLPDAADAASFWRNIQAGRYSITEVPADRWRVDLYYHPDASQPDKTYSKIGAWVRDFRLEPHKMGLAIPPRVLDQMDPAQQWAIAASHQALSDYGYPLRALDPARVAVILGNALAGEYHYNSSFRLRLPEYSDALTQTATFRSLPPEAQRALLAQLQDQIDARQRPITEDTMPGELSNIIAGRVANVFNLGGANYVTDAACASSLAALQNAMDGLNAGHFDAVLTGGVDRNMGPEGFIKFSKIGALSPDGSRPYADGANGFVMGEGAAIFLLKRLADAERDGDRIYAAIRGVGSSSDGKGKGITAPNPIGQQRAIERAWKAAGLDPRSAALIEGHGTSTRVGDVVEVGSLDSVFGSLDLPTGKIALGSVKSNIGHLKSAAGAAALLKTVYALREQVLPASVNFERPNPNIDFAHLPFRVNTAARPWEKKADEVRRAGISSFGFGGTNFHLVVEEHIPGLLTSDKQIFPVAELKSARPAEVQAAAQPLPAFYRGLLFLSADSTAELKRQLELTLESARKGQMPEQSVPSPDTLARSERLAMDFENLEELIKRGEKTLKAFESDSPAAWNALGAHAVYRGSGKAGKLAFLFPGQGSQYVNMLKDLCEVEPLAADTFREADEVMTPILGRPLTSYIYVDGDPDAIAQAETALKNTEITQPAVLTANVALLRLMKKFGFEPDLVIGHSLGEYAALVAAGVLTFPEALEVVSARGREMSKVSMEDNGCMAAVSAPLAEIERILKTIDGYVVLANINSPLQSVIGGSTAAVDAALAAFQAAGFQAVKIPVSHAFHTQIVAPASEPLRRVIARMNVQAPRIPVVANVTGGLYPTGKEEVLDILARQVASPVQFIRGVQTLYEQGARVFAEVGPKRVLSALTTDILKETEGITIVATNHPRKGARTSFNEALAGLYAAGVGPRASMEQRELPLEISVVATPEPTAVSDGRLPLTGSVVITGAGLGLPGRGKHVFEEDNVARILRGEQMIEPLPDEARAAMLERRVTRLEKSESGAQMVTIDSLDQTVKLAGQSGDFDLAAEFGVPLERVEATDISTQLAIAAGVEALRDAGIPLVMRYKRTSTGSYLPDRWMLPEALADETGVIFGSAFPGVERLAEESARFSEHQSLTNQLAEVRAMQAQFADQAQVRQALDQRVLELEAQLAKLDYHFDRRFIFRILAMGHSQFAEYIGARGPNTYVNAACATTTHAVSIAEDWIRTGRCRRVVVIAGDDVTDGNLVNWIGTGLLASGATTTEENLRMAALPFDRRRNGMIMGMGAAALVVESEDAARERGVRAICEILSTQIANSAYHGTRLNVQHISEVMERLVSVAEQRFGLKRAEMAGSMMFMSHETYTPARGGSAAAEIHALRSTFGPQANQVIVSNTKGFTGHTMGVGVEDVVAVKALETGQVPPIAHIDDGFDPDPELGDLNLSRGGTYQPEFALRLGAGFGSQIAMSLTRRVPGVGERIDVQAYSRWMAAVAGYDHAETEVVQHTLRICDLGAPQHEPRKSVWQYGQGPTMWAVSSMKREEVKREPVEETSPVPETVHDSRLTVHDSEIQQHLLTLVSEKTGYPPEMLELDLDLEADLGIDTVKQAELFAAVREHYGIQRREDLRLSDYNTLAKVMGFVKEGVKREDVKREPEEETSPVPETIHDSRLTIHDTEIQQHLLSLVSEKTGYPPEMLELDLDLEADLGIDTVKQAELFAAVRENYGIPRREDLRLSDYNTLAKVMSFVKDGLKREAEVKHESEVDTSPLAETAHDSHSTPHDASISRRIPVPVLQPRLELCLPTGVALDESSRVLVVADEGGAAVALARKLRGRKAAVVKVQPDSSDEFRKKLLDLQKEGPFDGVYFLPGLDGEPAITVMNLEEWNNLLETRLFALDGVLRGLPEKAFLVCATRMGGLHGYGPQPDAAAMSGSTRGLAKAIAREREGMLVKVVDFESVASHAQVANCLIEETLSDSSLVEVGREGDLRFGVALTGQALSTQLTGIEVMAELPKGAVFIVSGGSGGITAPVVQDLARATRGRFYLLGRSELPSPQDADLALLRNDREALKREIARRLADAGERATPSRVDAKLAALERAAATIETMAQVRQMGGKAVYIACDVTSPKAVDAAIQQVLDAEGRVDVLIHAAGIDHSRKLESKPVEEFRQVVAVKAGGLFHLWKALENRGSLPGHLAVFTSIAGRFGNGGQTDYSAANDLAARMVAAVRMEHPEIHAVALDWGAWAEVGMAARGYIPRLMQMAGIEMLDPQAAAPLVRAELERGIVSEVVLAGALGQLDHPVSAEGGLDLERANRALRDGKPIHTMLSRVTGMSLNEGVLLEAELDPNNEPFLKDHALNGIPVLPGVMGIEGFSVAARHIASVLGSAKAGFDVARLEDIQFLAPFKFYRNQPRRASWKARAVRTADGLTADVLLESDMLLHNRNVEHMRHFSGRVILQPHITQEEMTVKPPHWNGAYTVQAAEIYKLYFHGPAFQVLEGVQRSGEVVLGKLQRNLPAITSQGHALLSTPILLELCLQTAGVWEAGLTGMLALPSSIGELRIHRQKTNGVAIFAEVTPGRSADGNLMFDARVVDAKGRVYLEIDNYRTSPLPYSAEDELIQPFKTLVQGK